MKKINVITKDGYSIVAHIFKPQINTNKLIIINPATGIKQTFYFRYATYLATKGFTVLTYDYRGIGASKSGPLKGFTGSMKDWANLDFTAVSEYGFLKFPDHKKIVIGHSFGGNSIGLSPIVGKFDAYILIASQFGYWKNFNTNYKPLLLWLFYILMPLLVKAFGYFPSKVKQIGENLPKNVAKDWTTLITHPDSMLHLTKQTGNYYNQIKAPMLMLSFSDDNMAPKKTVDVLAKKAFKTAQVKRLHIETKKSQSIGHLNFFRKQFQKSLWDIPIKWYEELKLNNH